jgi:hypothetical protein
VRKKGMKGVGDGWRENFEAGTGLFAYSIKIRRKVITW